MVRVINPVVASTTTPNDILGITVAELIDFLRDIDELKDVDVEILDSEEDDIAIAIGDTIFTFSAEE